MLESNLGQKVSFHTCTGSTSFRTAIKYGRYAITLTTRLYVQLAYSCESNINRVLILAQYSYSVGVGSEINPSIMCKLSLHGARKSYQSRVTYYRKGLFPL